VRRREPTAMRRPAATPPAGTNSCRALPYRHASTWMRHARARLPDASAQGPAVPLTRSVGAPAHRVGTRTRAVRWASRYSAHASDPAPRLKVIMPVHASRTLEPFSALSGRDHELATARKQLLAASRLATRYSRALRSVGSRSRRASPAASPSSGGGSSSPADLAPHAVAIGQCESRHLAVFAADIPFAGITSTLSTRCRSMSNTSKM